MHPSRRTFLQTATAAGLVAVLPLPSRATGADVFQTTKGPLTLHPVIHASLILETSAGTILVDPAAGPAKYRSFPKPDLILITHHHGDHYKPNTIKALLGQNTKILTNPTVLNKLPSALKPHATALKNGETTNFNGLQIDAIPAYNLDPAYQKYHPPGRDNGYVITHGGFRTYIAGDTDAIPEMLTLKNIDAAFVPMTFPYTMGPKDAAKAVNTFKPRIAYPYHYGKASNVKTFTKRVNARTEVRTEGRFS